MEGEQMVEAPRQTIIKRRSWIIGLSSFLFVLLQSACTAIVALSGLRLVIGIGSLAAASSSISLLDSIHGDAIRIPMLILAIAGSILNLYVVWRVRSLRSRPSSSWRVAPITPEKRRGESVQVALAVITLLLVTVEWLAHIHLFGAAWGLSV